MRHQLPRRPKRIETPLVLLDAPHRPIELVCLALWRKHIRPHEVADTKSHKEAGSCESIVEELLRRSCCFFGARELGPGNVAVVIKGCDGTALGGGWRSPRSGDVTGLLKLDIGVAQP